MEEETATTTAAIKLPRVKKYTKKAMKSASKVDADIDTETPKNGADDDDVTGQTTTKRGSDSDDLPLTKLIDKQSKKERKEGDGLKNEDGKPGAKETPPKKVGLLCKIVIFEKDAFIKCFNF